MSMEMPVAGPEALTGRQVVAAARPVLPLNPRARALIRNALEFLILACLAFGSYVFISRFLLCSVQVVGVSMQPTLHNHERCLLNRWIFYVREPQRGDIVVIRDPADDGYSVKRVIGIHGDYIHLGTGALVLNGKSVKEPYLPGAMLTYPKPSVREQDILCGKDEFVVMGDNRMNSADSRLYGPVARKRILGLIIR